MGELSQPRPLNAAPAPAFTQQKLIQGLLYSQPVPGGQAPPDRPAPKFHIFPPSTRSEGLTGAPLTLTEQPVIAPEELAS